MRQPKIIQPADRRWEPHPRVVGAEATCLLSHQGDGAGLTCMLTRLPAGTFVESHSHRCEEIIYVLRGKATMQIDGAGAVSMARGAFLRIPSGVTHQPYGVEEDLLAYNVFYPYIA